MKRFLLIIAVVYLFIQPCYATWGFSFCNNNDEKKVAKVLKSQVKYANSENFEKFINTYDSKYTNADGFNLEEYSNLVQDIWNSFGKIKYGIEIKDIVIENNKATVYLTETAFANLNATKAYDGELKSLSDSVYYLEKINGRWKVVSDKVINETTSILYGEAKNLNITLTVPQNIEANTEYTATLEFVPPKETLAVASITSDIVEYPQKPAKEVFRALPDDNILERLFTSNNQNANEYVVASIGLTKTSVCDLSIKFNLIGFGYAIKRVNVISATNGEENDKNK